MEVWRDEPHWIPSNLSAFCLTRSSSSSTSSSPNSSLSTMSSLRSSTFGNTVTSALTGIEGGERLRASKSPTVPAKDLDPVLYQVDAHRTIARKNLDRYPNMPGWIDKPYPTHYEVRREW